MVFLDIMMPIMSGYEVYKRIREKYSPVELPIILLTARNQISDLIKGLEIGANDYLTKPFSRGEFIARMKTHLSISYYYKQIIELNRELNQNIKVRRSVTTKIHSGKVQGILDIYLE